MKKSLVLSVSLLAVVSAVVAQAATSGNIFGVQRIDSTSSQTIVCIPWIGTDGDDIDVADIIKTANLTPAENVVGGYSGDELWWYNTDRSAYVVWRLTSNKVWEKSMPGLEVGEPNPDPYNVTTLKRGQAIGIVRRNPVDGDGNAIPFFVHGQVSASTAQTTMEFPDAPSSTAPVYTLFAPPTASVEGVDVNEAATWSNIVEETGHNDGDQLIITVNKVVGKKTVTSQQFLYWSAANQKWGLFNLTRDDAKKGITDPYWKETSETKILAGCGAWFVSHGGTTGQTKTITWK